MAPPPPHKHSSAAIKEDAKVLVVGAGRIGCEVLKTLALSGCQDIHIIDKGFVEVSDLNGQFLFRQSHVGKSKASIARQAIQEFRPEINITSYHEDIKEPHFNALFFKQFNVVLIGLNNFDARRHVNRLCLTADVPFIDSCTVGFFGQVTVHVNGITECYECQPKPVAKPYPACTITSTPSEFVHCMVWAKDILFAKLFGNKSLTDDWNGDSSSEQADDIFVRKNDEDVEQYGRRIYDHVFGHNIEVALSNEETWNNHCKPKPIYSRDALPNDISQHNRNVETNGATNDPLSEHAMAYLGLQHSRAVLSLEENSRIFLEALKLLWMKKEKRFGNITFDKEDQLAVVFVTAAANIRASGFGIPLHSLFAAKRIVGNIVPAVATTNAIIAGLIVIETVKVLQNDKKNYRMTYCLEHLTNKMLLTPVKPLEPNKSCYVCSETPLSLEINTNHATLRDIVEKVVKNKLGMNYPLIRHGKDYLYEYGIILDAAVIINYEANLDKVLSEFDSPVTSGTMLKIEDFQQDMSFSININHREDFDEEKEPDGMVLYALTQATSVVKDDEKFDANAGSTSNASELEADNNEIEIAAGMKRKRSEVVELNSDDSADERYLSNEGFKPNELKTVGEKLCGICGKSHHDSFDARRLSNEGFKFNEQMAVGGKGCRVCGSDQHHSVNCPLLTFVPRGSIVGPDYLVICCTCRFELCQPTPNRCFMCCQCAKGGRAVEASMVDESFRDIQKDYSVVSSDDEYMDLDKSTDQKNTVAQGARS